MRVVIADDEKFVLVVLKSALRSVRFPIEIVGEALDGDDAYPALLQEKAGSFDHGYLYASARTDSICLQSCSETQPELPVIIYSGFDNFSYAAESHPLRRGGISAQAH